MCRWRIGCRGKNSERKGGGEGVAGVVGSGNQCEHCCRWRCGDSYAQRRKGSGSRELLGRAPVATSFRKTGCAMGLRPSSQSEPWLFATACVVSCALTPTPVMCIHTTHNGRGRSRLEKFVSVSVGSDEAPSMNTASADAPVCTLLPPTGTCQNSAPSVLPALDRPVTPYLRVPSLAICAQRRSLGSPPHPP